MQQLNTTLDHLIFGCYSLDEAVDFIDQQLGVQAETGGRHLTMGTYNKLLKLDDTTYFEIIAIDPEGKKPDRPRWFNMDKFRPGSKPQLITWVVRTNDIQQAVGLPIVGASVRLCDSTLTKFNSIKSFI